MYNYKSNSFKNKNLKFYQLDLTNLNLNFIFYSFISILIWTMHIKHESYIVEQKKAFAECW